MINKTAITFLMGIIIALLVVVVSISPPKEPEPKGDIIREAEQALIELTAMNRKCKENIVELNKVYHL